MNQRIYRNWDTKKTVDLINAVSGVLLNIAYPQKPTWDIYYRDNNKNPVDLTGYIFRAAMDTDFNDETDVMSRSSYEMVDVSEAADGIIKVKNNSDNARFYSQVNGQKTGQRQVTFQIYGCRPGQDEDWFDSFPVLAIMPVDPYGATKPPPEQETTWASQSWVESRIRAGREIQFSVDGETLWHDTQVLGIDLYWRERYPQGEWSTAIAMVRGLQGIPGPGTTSCLAFASDVNGSNFSFIPTNSLKYRAELIWDNQLSPPQQSDFSEAVWVKYLGDDGSLIQVPSDWNATEGAARILNKPNIPAPQVQSDWNAIEGIGVILNKPNLAESQVNADWNASEGVAVILNKPSIPAAQVQTDWNATEGIGVLVNKPSTFPPASHNHALNNLSEKSYNSLTDKPSIPSAQVQSDWNASEGLGVILNKPAIPAAQVQSDWNATGGLGVILNKPTSLGGGTTIKTLLFRVPNMDDDSALHIALEVFTTVDYSGAAVESFNSAVAQTYLEIFDGSAWLAFPAEGVGNPFYENKLSVALQLVESGTQYYIRYKWFIKDTAPANTPWEYSQYPNLEVTSNTPAFSHTQGTDIDTVMFRVPTMDDDSALHFTLEAYATTDFSGDSILTVNSATSQEGLKISNGAEWEDFPAEGIGTPYYDQQMAITFTGLEAGVKYYLRYKWYIKNTSPSAIPWFLSQYPSIELGGKLTTVLDSASLQVLTDASNILWNLNNGSIALLSIAGDRVLSNPINKKAGTYILKVMQGAGGSHVLTFDSNYKWSGGAVPSLSTEVGAVDIITFFCDGTNMYGAMLGGFA